MQKIVIFVEEFGAEMEIVLIQNLEIISLFVFGAG
jgi:hypothetical protein